MNQQDIRQTFYDFFTRQGHRRVLSAPVVPAQDPTLLFTNAGMNQFKGVFLRQEQRAYQRAVTIQKCMRVSGKHNDFDEVGRTDFHHTFFEMMGNFSFGDYFKEEAIRFAWSILTEGYHFDPERLWITVFREDEEAARLWEDRIGIPRERIVFLDEKDNFWQMGDTGPCGPCSEIHFDRGEAFGAADLAGGSKRYVEIWNLVFMQYDRDRSGVLNPLPAPSIDTGMGIERLSAILQGARGNYGSDLFLPLISATAERCGKDPGAPEHQVAFKVVADHLRALTFLIADGVMPANDGRGYVLRRVLRRAARHGRTLGFDGPFLHHLCHAVVDLMTPYYPELEERRPLISRMVLAEEERFGRTLDQGLRRFEELLLQMRSEGVARVPGEELFRLSDTYGFPLDFAMDLAREQDLPVDLEGYQAALARQKEQSRAAAAQRAGGLSLKLPGEWETVFTGYREEETETSVLGILDAEGLLLAELAPGAKAWLVTPQTPFYAESGGQVGDEGEVLAPEGRARILRTRKEAQGRVLHEIELSHGLLRTGDSVRLRVDGARRLKTAVHHSATHLLHAALREVLGPHVRQAGSLVEPERLRFDFTHFQALSQDELRAVEGLVNAQVRANLSVATEELAYEQALERGAMAIFEEKYADRVRMVSMGPFSLELCGGTHLQATGQIGLFRILSESSISAGIRRIEAVGGEAAWEESRADLELLGRLESRFSQRREALEQHLVQMEQQLRERDRQLRQLERERMDRQASGTDLEGSIRSLAGISCLLAAQDHLDRKALSALADRFKAKGVLALLWQREEGKVAFVLAVPETRAQLRAGDLARELGRLLNGKGGGRADFAQGGGSWEGDAGALEEALTRHLTGLLERAGEG